MKPAIKVLLVDDETEFADCMAKVLGRRNMEVSVAYTGADAVAAFAQGEFDVVVLDLRMPGMDGLATLDALRVRDTLTPVLLLSGHTDLEDAAAALARGAADFLVKPCAVEALATAIEDASERKALARALRGLDTTRSPA